MKKKNKAVEGLLVLLMILPLLYLLMIYPSLPDLVPTHFDINGKADDWSSKSGLPIAVILIQVFLYGLMKYTPSIDPKKNFDRFDKLYQKLRIITQLFISLLAIVIIHSARGTEMDVRGGLLFSIVVFVVLMGNYLQSVKPNYFIGVRTPWAFENETVWIKTNRLIGRVWFYGGLVLLAIMYFLDPLVNLKLMLALTLSSTFYGMAYSYFLYRKMTKKEE